MGSDRTRKVRSYQDPEQDLKLDPELDQDGASPVAGAGIAPTAAGALLCSRDNSRADSHAQVCPSKAIGTQRYGQ